MDTIKKILSPNNDEEGTRTSASGLTSTQDPRTGTASNLTGEGSHLAGTSRSGTTGAVESQASNNHMPGEYPAEAVSQSGNITNNPPYGSSGQEGLSSGTTSTQGGLTAAPVATTSGPHSSNIANKVDPRVDSDSSRIGTSAGNPLATGQGISRVGDAGTAPVGSSTADRGYAPGSGNTLSSTTGTHSSSLTNEAAPSVDPNFDRSTAAGNNAGSTATARAFPLTGGSSSTASGPHSSNIANTTDPRIESDNARLGGSSVAGASTGASGFGNTSDAYGSSTGGSGNHQIGYDAAAIGAGAAVGSASSRGFHTTSGPHQTDTANLLDPKVSGGSSQREDGIHHFEQRGVTGGGAEEADKTHQNFGNTPADNTRVADAGLADRSGQSGIDSSSHTGRNAALGVGSGLGAAGLAKHEHDKHQAERSAGPISSSAGTTTTTNTNTSSSITSGPHSSNLANKADPRVDSDNSKAYPSTVGQSTTSTTAAGAGTGLGAASLDSHAGPGTYGSTNQSALDRSGNRSIPSQSTATTTSATPGNDHHYVRDAAVVGGVAGVGAAAHGASQHHQGQTSGVNSASQFSSQPHPGQGITGAEASGAESTGAISHATVNPTHPSSTTGGPLSSNITDSSRTGTATDRGDHHYGRDAAVAGGAAYAADQHHKDKQYEKAEKKEQKHAEKDAHNAQKHAQKQLDKDVKHAHKDAEHEKKDSKGGLLGFLHRDKNKDNEKYTPEERAEFESHRDNNLTNPSHKREGEAAALGGTAAGVGAYEAGKHHETSTGTIASEHKDIGDHLHGQRNRGVVGSSGFPDTEGFASGEVPSHEGFGTTNKAEHHYGRDAAAVGGVGVATGLGKHEYDQHHNTATGASNTSTEGLGTTRTGIHSSSAGGVDQNITEKHTGTHGTTDHQYGRDATAVRAVGGAAALGKHEYNERHNTAGTSGHSAGDISQSTTGTHAATHSTTDRHHGRDAAAVGGAAALGKHEYDQHHNTTGEVKSSHTGTTDHHHGRDAAALGGTAALGKHEYDQHHNTTGEVKSSHTGTTDHHHGRDAAVVGGTAALGKHEYDQHHNTTGGVKSSHTGTSDMGSTGLLEHDPNKNYTTTGTGATLGSDLGSSEPRRLSEAATDQDGNTIGGHSVSSAYQTGAAAGDRNRLHKDPPAGHPASETATTGTHTTHGALGTRESGVNTSNLETNTGVQGSGGNQY